MAAVAGASPVTMTVRTPNVRNSVMSAAESDRGGSLRAMIPASFTACRRAYRDGQHPEALWPPVGSRSWMRRARVASSP